MNIDIRTLILIIGITHFIQVLVFYNQYKTNKTIKGPSWWLLWSSIEVLGFIIILLRNIPSLTTLIIVFQDGLILLGGIFIYIGILKFFDKRVNWKFIAYFFASFLTFHLFFIFVKDDIHMRTLALDLYISTIAFLTAFTLYKNKTHISPSTINFNIAVFVVHGGVFAYRSIMIISGAHVEDIFEQTVFNLIQYFDALIVSLLWTFALIILINQKLNIEVSEAKIHFERIFSTSPDAVIISRLSDGAFIDVNNNFTKIIGYQKNEILGKSVIDINLWKNPRDRNEFVKIISENGSCENNEYQFIRKDGLTIIGLVSAKIILLNKTSYIISVIRDITDRKETELNILRTAETLTFLAKYSNIDPNKNFFEELAQYLANAIKADYVCIDKLEGDGLNATTIAVWHDGNFEDNVTYSLKDTPCGDVVGKTVCCFPTSVTKLFPNDKVLQDLKAESYVGVTLWNHIGDPIGLIAVIKKTPLDNKSQAEELLKLVAIRASGELERIKAEETLKDSEQRLQFVLKGSQLGFWDWNLKTNEVKRNEQWAEMLGYKLDEVEFTIKQWVDFIHPDDKEKALKSIQDHLDGLTPQHRIEYRMQTKTGEYKWILDQAQAVAWDSNQKVIRMSGTHTDITERKTTDIALQESEKKYRLLFQNLSAGFALHEIILNSDGNPVDYRFLELNPAFEELTGADAKDLIGRTALEVLPKTESYWIDNYGKVALTGIPISFENYSAEFNKHYQVNAYSPEYGKFATIFNDITEKKQAEIEIQNKNDELTKISSDKDMFISILAHDLKSPFNSILGYLDLLTENVHTYSIDKIKNQISIINHSARNAYSLLEDILLWARSQSGKIPFKPQTINLAITCNEIIDILSSNANAKEISINNEIENNITIVADVDMLKTILRNLISNAIKYTNKGGQINLRTEHKDLAKKFKQTEHPKQSEITNSQTFSKYQIISVSDNGIGIDSETVNKLFETSKAGTTKGTANEGGTGLGLMLCKEFVNIHGGEIWVESEIDKGSTFYFTLQKAIDNR